jgi:hypothetical protein
MTPDRRSFLQSSALGLGGLAFLTKLPAAEVGNTPVRLDPEVEPIVRLIEETPRNRLLEEVAERIRKGLSYRDVLAGLLLAGVRNVPPRPTVGFKFHAVLVVNSAHLASQASPDGERWLPLFWALDNFKQSQATTIKESGWRMGPVDEPHVPTAHEAKAAFAEAMETWDEAKADVAAAAVARTVSVNEAFELFARYGCRDFRDIGHKAIYVANAFRTLQTIGWRFAEPVLRSLAYALLQHEGDNPAKRDGAPDRPGRRNAELAKKLRTTWADGKLDSASTGEVLTSSRTASDAELSEKAAELVNNGTSPRSVWDGLFAAAGELLMRQPGIVALHSLTSLNALHYAYQTSAVDDTRRLALLQAAAFVPLFRDAMKSRGKVGDAKIDELAPAEKVTEVGDVFATLSKDKTAAARMALGYLKRGPEVAREVVDAGRLLIFLKGNDSHDYKFSSAVMEDYASVSPAWRDRFLAASLFWLKGSAGPDAPLVKRARAALA